MHSAVAPRLYNINMQKVKISCGYAFIQARQQLVKISYSMPHPKCSRNPKMAFYLKVRYLHTAYKNPRYVYVQKTDEGKKVRKKVQGTEIKRVG